MKSANFIKYFSRAIAAVDTSSWPSPHKVHHDLRFLYFWSLQQFKFLYQAFGSTGMGRSKLFLRKDVGLGLACKSQVDS